MEISGAMGINIIYCEHLLLLSVRRFAAVAGILVGIYYNQVYPTMVRYLLTRHYALLLLAFRVSTWAVIASLLLGMGNTSYRYANIPLPRDALALLL
jgi:branched-chain amino acid transport system permease protein